MNKDTIGLDKKIKGKFKLFSGIRPQEEDQKIYDKVLDLCFDEMVAFLGDNLSEKEREDFLGELGKKASDEDKAKVLQASLSKIENYRFKLDHRLDAFLNNLLLSSLSNLKDK